MNVCTIIAKNYVAQARVLARSFAEHHPDGRFWTLIIDDFAGYIDPAQEPFEILTPADIGCDSFAQMALSYSVLELSTAVKPWLLRHLLAQTGGPVTYLDPDIKIFASLEGLDQLAAERGLVLTPHNNVPVPPDGRRPSQVDIMISGVFNLGYVSVAPRPEIESLLDWWADRLLRDCRVDPVWGYFVDQRWFDLAPGLVSELAILRDPEYNVAYWNLHSRQLERAGDQYTVDGRPLAFFHFSGFDAGEPLVLSRHQDRIDVAEHPVLEGLLAAYAAEVFAEGYGASRDWPYDFATLGDGTPVDDMLRGAFDAFRDQQEALGVRTPSPFESGGAQAFLDWCQEQAPGAAPGVTRALAEVYRRRPDLQSTYPDLAGAGGVALTTWSQEVGRYEVSTLARLLSSPDGSPPPGGWDATSGPGTSEPVHPLRDAPWGVNVIGQFNSELPGGDAARDVVSTLDALGIPAAPVLAPTTASARHDTPYVTTAAEDAPFAVNLICLPPDGLLAFLRTAGRAMFAGRYSIGLFEAEASETSESLAAALSILEEAWAPTEYARAALAIAPGVAVPGAAVPGAAVPFPVDITAVAPPSRLELGLPADRFLFLCPVDLSEDLERQNPLAAIRAFAAARQPGDHAELVLRCYGRPRDGHARAQLLEAAAGEGILVSDRGLSPSEERSVIAQCDCVVSLHREVSFGRRLVEAMGQGKPVIATGYSGNLDYMNQANSLLVDYQPVSSQPDLAAGGRPWAEPDIAHAAQRMREVLDDPQSVRRLGDRAATDIEATYSPAAAGQAMARRLASVRATGRARVAAEEISQLPPALIRLPLRLQEARRRQAAPGRGRRARELARRGVQVALRPVTRSQQAVNEAFMAALSDLNRTIVEVRSEEAAKRAGLLARLRHYERRLARAPAPETERPASEPDRGPESEPVGDGERA